MVVKMVYKFMAVVAMMVIGMTVSSCEGNGCTDVRPVGW